MAHTYSALSDYQRRIANMLDDPECTEDLFALGIALLDFAVLQLNREERSWRFYAERAWGNASEWHIRGVLKGDIRRYDALKDADANGPARRCGAPMVRRQGPCGQSGSRRALLTDADTGRKQWIAACKRHEDWFRSRVLSNRLAVEDDSEPVISPPANAGGVLARHIPEIDWPEMWRKLNPSWTPPPETVPEEIPLTPRLRLVLGDGA